MQEYFPWDTDTDLSEDLELGLRGAGGELEVPTLSSRFLSTACIAEIADNALLGGGGT